MSGRTGIWLCALALLLAGCTKEGNIIQVPDPADSADTSPLVMVLYDPGALGDLTYNDLIFAGVERMAGQHGLRTMQLSPRDRKEGLSYLSAILDRMSSARDTVRRLLIVAGDGYDEYLRANNRRLEANPCSDLLLKTYAVNVAVGMWDDYWNSGSNYFLYLAPDKKGDGYKVWLIPYDYDNTLGTSHDYCAQTDSGRQDPWHWGMDSAPLMTKILKNAEWAALYKKYLQDLCAEEGDFYYKTAMARIKAWQNTIAPYVPNDTQEDIVIEDKPAYWGNHHEYRIMEEGENNFFQVKAEAIRNM